MLVQNQIVELVSVTSKVLDLFVFVCIDDDPHILGVLADGIVRIPVEIHELGTLVTGGLIDNLNAQKCRVLTKALGKCLRDLNAELLVLLGIRTLKESRPMQGAAAVFPTILGAWRGMNIKDDSKVVLLCPVQGLFHESQRVCWVDRSIDLVWVLDDVPVSNWDTKRVDTSLAMNSKSFSVMNVFKWCLKRASSSWRPISSLS